MANIVAGHGLFGREGSWSVRNRLDCRYEIDPTGLHARFGRLSLTPDPGHPYAACRYRSYSSCECEGHNTHSVYAPSAVPNGISRNNEITPITMASGRAQA